jgi:hypothetical protein
MIFWPPTTFSSLTVSQWIRPSQQKPLATRDLPSRATGVYNIRAKEPASDRPRGISHKNPAMSPLPVHRTGSVRFSKPKARRFCGSNFLRTSVGSSGSESGTRMAIFLASVFNQPVVCPALVTVKA